MIAASFGNRIAEYLLFLFSLKVLERMVVAALGMDLN